MKLRKFFSLFLKFLIYKEIISNCFIRKIIIKRLWKKIIETKNYWIYEYGFKRKTSKINLKFFN